LDPYRLIEMHGVGSITADGAPPPAPADRRMQAVRGPAGSAGGSDLSFWWVRLVKHHVKSLMSLDQ
jgi:hypothetical protein